ncbi:ABC transporter ATP-binding protein [Jiella pacifica]|uniref:ATP-binding cassette domain-containing protein n=1 Tax=Jiella pacifica TaxID=2696469 RepID=A0A6N9T6F8_9HYPH|nr:ABC transporter ATP-binding protein [Jiella pacifica]NDW05646.1 ATP-binding cassette domain-containing protein [Jiella pacifica]
MSRLVAKGLTRRAGGRAIVDGVSLELVEGEFLALVGPNGSGKSTLISMLAGLKRPHAGDVRLGGARLDKTPRRDVARAIAVVEQQAETGERLTAREVVALGRTPHLGALSPWGEEDEAAVEAALAAVDMLRFADRDWHSLSGGERQRLHIARALAQEPGIVILDEPTNHLDIEHQLAILALVKARRMTVLAALHDLNHAALFADRIAVMDQGRLVALGRPGEVLTPERIATTFKVAAMIETAADGGCHIRFMPLPHGSQPPSRLPERHDKPRVINLLHGRV